LWRFSPKYDVRHGRFLAAMGYQDRDYIRDDRGGASVWSTMSVTAKLIALNVVLYLVNLFFGGERGAGQGLVTDALSLSPDSLVNPLYWYQFLTAGFVHDSRAPAHIFGNMLGLFFFGRPLEDKYGGREFLRFYLVAILVGNITWALRQYFVIGPITVTNGQAYWPYLLGASGAVTACIILFIVQNPKATLFAGMLVPVPAWLVGVLYIGMNILGMASEQNQERVAYDVHLTGAAFAVAYWYFGWNFRWLPGLDGSGGLRKAKRWFKPQPTLKVHAPETDYEDLDAEADTILEKLHVLGEGSLTAREKKILEDYSRRIRQKLR
jgi:membrane associated rhomboid family serine protease